MITKIIWKLNCLHKPKWTPYFSLIFFLKISTRSVDKVEGFGVQSGDSVSANEPIFWSWKRRLLIIIKSRNSFDDKIVWIWIYDTTTTTTTLAPNQLTFVNTKNTSNQFKLLRLFFAQASRKYWQLQDPLLLNPSYTKKQRNGQNSLQPTWNIFNPVFFLCISLFLHMNQQGLLGWWGSDSLDFRLVYKMKIIYILNYLILIWNVHRPHYHHTPFKLKKMPGKEWK